MWQELRKVARPDSRFHWDFAEFIPDYEGSQQCADAIRQMDWYQASSVLFITPDNNLARLRQHAVQDDKTIIVATYGIVRGFLIMGRQDVPPGQECFAASLDGMEEFARAIDLDGLGRLGRIDLLITGASIINHQGVRWGKGHGYFDLEWAMMRELGLVEEATPIIAVAHDCQVIDLELTPAVYDTVVDRIVTPSRVIDVERTLPKPLGIFWDQLDPTVRERIPPLAELYARTKEEVEPGGMTLV